MQKKESVIPICTFKMSTLFRLPIGTTTNRWRPSLPAVGIYVANNRAGIGTDLFILKYIT